jgi:hypothetical protein
MNISPFSCISSWCIEQLDEYCSSSSWCIGQLAPLSKMIHVYYLLDWRKTSGYRLNSNP